MTANTSHYLIAQSLILLFVLAMLRGKGRLVRGAVMLSQDLLWLLGRIGLWLWRHLIVIPMTRGGWPCWVIGIVGFCALLKAGGVLITRCYGTAGMASGIVGVLWAFLWIYAGLPRPPDDKSASGGGR
jgi:hypothetical protein